MKIDQLIGTWTLVKHGTETQDGVFRSTSDYLKGQIIYSPDGGMSVFILKKETPATFADVIVYSGRFTLQADRILHHIEIAPDPARRGTTEVRLFQFADPILRLSTVPTEAGRFVIEWTKQG